MSADKLDEIVERACEKMLDLEEPSKVIIRAALDEARQEAVRDYLAGNPVPKSEWEEMVQARQEDRKLETLWLGAEQKVSEQKAEIERLRAEKGRICEHRGDVVCALCQGAEIERLRAQVIEADTACRCRELQDALAAERAKLHKLQDAYGELLESEVAERAKVAKLVEALERLHYSVFDPYDETDGRLHFCNGCRHQWPCPTSKALAAAKASE